jgi:hypothetical protein
MTWDVPHLPGILSADEALATAEHIAGLQLANGMIPWYPGGHCDPWNHVETAMALDVARLHEPARAAYRWLAETQRPDGSWHNYYLPDGSVEDPKLDTNVCAYVAVGVWHHYLCTNDVEVARELWPTVRSAVQWVLSMQLPTGAILWAREVDDTPWDYALLTGSSSVFHAVECAVRLAEVVGDQQSGWPAAQARLGDAINDTPEVFADKSRWAMDWYYPVLCGVSQGEQAKARLAEHWDTFVMDGRGVRCVSDEPWVTAAETAECALSHAATGDMDTAIEILGWTRRHRRDDGAYWTGIVHPHEELFPEDEHTAYTAAAIILAADVITDTSPATSVFRHPAP